MIVKESLYRNSRDGAIVTEDGLESGELVAAAGCEIDDRQARALGLLPGEGVGLPAEDGEGCGRERGPEGTRIPGLIDETIPSFAERVEKVVGPMLEQAERETQALALVARQDLDDAREALAAAIAAERAEVERLERRLRDLENKMVAGPPDTKSRNPATVKRK